MLTRVSVVALVVMVFAAGCGGVSFDRDAEGNLLTTIRLEEAAVNEVIVNALAAAGDPLLRDTQIDMQNGVIVVTGTYDRPDGSPVAGSFTMTMTAQNGAMLTQITQANIEGIDVGSNRIANINAQLAAGFQQRAARSSRTTVQSVTVTNSAVEITLLTASNN